MKFVHGILALFTALMVLLTSNGFVYEYYFCRHCHKEHNEISLFEFGKISHNHKCQEECHEHHHANHCHCNKCLSDCKYHLNHTHIKFFSLKQLFFAEHGNNLPKIQTIQYFFDTNEIFAAIEYCFKHKIFAHTNAPPTIKLLHGGEVCTILSCFRL